MSGGAYHQGGDATAISNVAKTHFGGSYSQMCQGRRKIGPVRRRKSRPLEAMIGGLFEGCAPGPAARHKASGFQGALPLWGQFLVSVFGWLFGFGTADSIRLDQGEFCDHSRSALTSAFAILISFLMSAVRATLAGFPAAIMAWYFLARSGLWRAATRAGM